MASQAIGLKRFAFGVMGLVAGLAVTYRQKIRKKVASEKCKESWNNFMTQKKEGTRRAIRKARWSYYYCYYKTLHSTS